ncbi:MAG: SMC-Scp complex subunit ScpB [Deltaproteobacteria bacterium]|nr:SMC-Scp complex subunit ScpB [Deltaproteobacteria bacterium]MBI2500496.1 SMC-Scp complex subunit ScpB [Deltaproteobacteria bacterium]
MELKALLESILFSSDRPLGASEILSVLDSGPEQPGVKKKEIEEVLEQMVLEWEGRGGGIRLVKVAGGYEFRTDPQMAPWIQLLNPQKAQRLSGRALETVALIAYRQPLTRVEIENIRGVDSSGILKTLLEKRLIRVVGRKEEPGRPLLFATTKEFLELFGLNDLNDLPPLSELEEKVKNLPKEEGTDLQLGDLMRSVEDLNDLDEKDREILGELEERIKDLKATEEEVLQGQPQESSEGDLDKEEGPP